jgi:Na+-transporting methylmalonyl-CoA/oxaloacetate decarboxylase gamma subunit
MGRTIPSFRIALAMEKEDWKPFRNALDKSDRKKFDDMFDIPRLYTSACSYAVQPVRLYPILMSILLYHFKELSQCISEVERIEARLNSKYKESTKEKEEEEKQLAQPRAVTAALLQQERQSKLLEY